jgi:hypothetical protein
MNFLKKIGSFVLKIIGLWTGLSPLLGGLYAQGSTADKVIDKFGQAFGVIGSVEQVFTSAFGSGHKMPSEKLAAAVPYLSQIVQSTDLLIGKKPHDEAMFAAGISDLGSALVKILNSYGE